MKLLSFGGYSKVAPYIPFARPVNLTNLDGYAAGAGWLQIFDRATAPTGGTVPLKSFNVAAAGPLMSLFQTLGAIALQTGLVIAFSSTEATYTADATSFDAFGEVEDYRISPDAETTETAAGDDTLEIWADNITEINNRLLRFTVTSGMATDCYVQLFAHSPSNGAIPLAEWLLPAGESITEDFGVDGREVRSLISGARHYGAVLYCSSTPGVLTQTSDLSNDFSAEY